MCEGGAIRAQSVRNALAQLKADAEDWVIVHDAVRPCLRTDTLKEFIEYNWGNPTGVILAATITDSIKRVKRAPVRSGLRVVDTLSRDDLLVRAVTPQMFRYRKLCDALDKALADGINIDDEAAAMMHANHQVDVMLGEAQNIKITYRTDIEYARRWLNYQKVVKPGIRIGSGFDVHAFCAGDHLYIGGIKIPHERGLDAHSDGDVLLHALCDAFLGAAALGDIGSHFPDNDDRFKDIDSRRLLKQVCLMLTDKGYEIINVDATVIAQVPKLLPFVGKIRQSVAETLGVSEDCVNIKATTTEALGFIGRREGIAAHSIVLIEKHE